MTPKCSCGQGDETVYHYFIQCKNYNKLRTDLLTEIELECLNVETLLHGSPKYSTEYNLSIQKVAQDYIIGSARFS